MPCFAENFVNMRSFQLVELPDNAEVKRCMLATEQKEGAQLGIEPRTSPTLRENYTTKPLSRLYQFSRFYVFHHIFLLQLPPIYISNRTKLP